MSQPSPSALTVGSAPCPLRRSGRITSSRHTTTTQPSLPAASNAACTRSSSLPPPSSSSGRPAPSASRPRARSSPLFRSLSCSAVCVSRPPVDATIDNKEWFKPEKLWCKAQVRRAWQYLVEYDGYALSSAQWVGTSQLSGYSRSELAKVCPYSAEKHRQLPRVLQQITYKDYPHIYKTFHTTTKHAAARPSPPHSQLSPFPSLCPIACVLECVNPRALFCCFGK